MSSYHSITEALEARNESKATELFLAQVAGYFTDILEVADSFHISLTLDDKKVLIKSNNKKAHTLLGKMPEHRHVVVQAEYDLMRYSGSIWRSEWLKEQLTPAIEGDVQLRYLEVSDSLEEPVLYRHLQLDGKKVAGYLEPDQDSSTVQDIDLWFDDDFRIAVRFERDAGGANDAVVERHLMGIASMFSEEDSDDLEISEESNSIECELLLSCELPAKDMFRYLDLLASLHKAVLDMGGEIELHNTFVSDSVAATPFAILKIDFDMGVIRIRSARID
jgi:hypothetical protein